MEKTNPNLRNLVIYQIYVRNYSTKGTFQAIIDDLDRIKTLGVDMIYLLPIHPIGELNRKGSLGCPYSIQDYRAINPKLGTIDDFRRLIDAVHEEQLKLMIDIVFNHTSRDSRLLKEHPEWMYKNNKGEFSSRVEEWSDVADFDFSSGRELWDELTNTLMIYADMGVDGFRADVASLVPLDFWKYARKTIAKDYRNIIWLSESVHGSFVKEIRDSGYDCSSECEMFQVFDMAYDYDVAPLFIAYLEKKLPLKVYLEAIAKQEEIYPGNYVKLKNIENHDTRRIADYLKNDLDKILNWTGFCCFQKGAMMIYNGQEFASDVRLSLFEKAQIVKRSDISSFIMKLTKIKKRKVFASGIYKVNFPEIDGVAYNTFEDDKEKIVGIFNVGAMTGKIKIDLKDGKYRNYLTGKTFTIKEGLLTLSNDPLVIHIKK